MKVIAKWPDPRNPGVIIDQSRDCGGGPFRDDYFMAQGKTVAAGAVPVSQSERRAPSDMNISNARNSTDPRHNHFNGKRKA